MSIQDTAKKQLKHKLIAKFHLKKLISLPGLSREIIQRATHHDPLKVYFRYQHIDLYTHPIFDRLYKHPPLAYCNLWNANLYHWISSPDRYDDKPFIIEPNDHPLAPTGLSQPIDVINNISKAKSIYSLPQCKKILVEFTGQLELFQRYCSEVLPKCEIVRGGSIPKIIDFNQSEKTLDQLTFLCLASDFVKKGVDLLLDAWFEFSDRKKHKLLLVCPWVPENYANRALNENVIILKKAPLSPNEKDVLHSQAHVAIGPLHIDGSANMIEAMEFGLPIITMRYHRSQDLIMNNNGFVAEVPFCFYDEGYGYEWPTWEEFFRVLSSAKLNGDFDKTKEDFVKSFQYFSDNPLEVINMGKRSYELAKDEFSLTKRNKQLLKIYKESLNLCVE